MNAHDRDPALDRRLGELLHDAVAGVEPDDRLGELRARVSAPSRRRPALAALIGAAVAGAVAVTAVAVVGPRLVSDPEPAEPPVATAPTDAPSEEPSAAEETTRVPTATRSVAGYYLGDTPAGVRLFREFRDVEAADDGPAASVRMLTTDPADPDYRTAWPQGAFAGAEVGDEQITVELADRSLEARPDTMSEEEAQASVQQVVYTLQAYAQQRLPVEFVTSSGPALQVLGTTPDGPVSAAPQLDVLSHVNLSDPVEGERASSRFQVTGVANGFEGNVQWSLLDTDERSVADGFFTAEGWMGDRLFPFEGEVDLGSVAPGTYTFVVQTEDASGGVEGPGAYSDTRTVVVE